MFPIPAVSGSDLTRVLLLSTVQDILRNMGVRTVARLVFLFYPILSSSPPSPKTGMAKKSVHVSADGIRFHTLDSSPLVRITAYRQVGTCSVCGLTTSEIDRSEFTSPMETNGPVIVGVSWFLFAFCSCFLALRLYAKLSRAHGLWWDDWILIFSWVSRDCLSGSYAVSKPSC
jgi:hypothetical protein